MLIVQQALSTEADVFTPLRSIELAELLLGLSQHASTIWDQVVLLSQAEINNTLANIRLAKLGQRNPSKHI